MDQNDILSIKCSKHNLEAVGFACDEVYCIECSREDQENYKGSNLDKGKHPGYGNVVWIEEHGKIIFAANKQ